MKINSNDENSLTSLIKLAMMGHFPIFNKSWLESAYDQRIENITTQHKIITERIIQRLARFKNINEKKAVLSRLSEGDKKIFIQTFLYMLEKKILDSTPDLH